ncbi:MAG: alpha/beta hydrolase, partial [Actinomycetes bacterium]
PSSTAPSSTAPSSTAQPTVAGVFVAAGVRQWLHCQGSGPLTVVVVTGLQTPASAWASVRPTLERITRTCVYDRPGLGRSPARHDTTRVVDAELYARELVALLAAAGEGRRVVLVGHSFGGLIARAFVAIDPTRVRGVLLAESVTPHDPTTGAYWAEAGHRVNMVASSVAASPPKASHEPAFGRLPLLVLSASNPEGDHLGGPTYGQPPSRTELWRTQQRAELALSDNAIQVIARSGHVLQQDNPAAVVDAVRALVTAATTGKFLQCKNIWHDDKATCR